jgi:uncharacterized protein (DUF1778 family)
MDGLGLTFVPRCGTIHLGKERLTGGIEMTNDTTIKVRLPKSLRDKVQADAEHQGHTISSFIRYVLRRWCDADAVTIENARDRRTIDLDTLIGPGPSLDWGMDPNARLVDPGVAYETEEAE